MRRASFSTLVTGAVMLWCAWGHPDAWAQVLDQKAALGKKLFFEAKLSFPDGQSCASCHDPAFGFSEPDQEFATSEGVLRGRFGPRNSQTANYLATCPPLHYDSEKKTYVGGMFWSGNEDDLAAQAQQPFFAPVEMHNFIDAQVVLGVVLAGLAPELMQVYGPTVVLPQNSHEALVAISDAIAAYELTRELNAFDSKFDYYQRGQARLTAEETQGLAVFNGKGKCHTCHPSSVQGNESGPLFTDFAYYNLGIPKNLDNPFLYGPPRMNPEGVDFIDEGLANVVARFDPEGAAAQNGKFKTPTLRNLERTAPYSHNGVFLTIKDAVHFHNTRDIPDTGWAAPEITDNLSTDNVGDLGLTGEEEDALVAFLKTLTDGYRPSPLVE
jgi:cytochrome c peroxidase